MAVSAVVIDGQLIMMPSPGAGYSEPCFDTETAVASNQVTCLVGGNRDERGVVNAGNLGIKTVVEEFTAALADEAAVAAENRRALVAGLGLRTRLNALLPCANHTGAKRPGGVNKVIYGRMTLHAIYGYIVPLYEKLTP